MIIQLSFSELQNYIARNFRQDAEFTMVDKRTVFVGTTVRLPFISKDVGLNISVLKIAGQVVTLAYTNGLGVDLIIKGVLKFVKNVLPEYGQVIDEREGNIIELHLDRVKQLEQVFEYADLQDIWFADEKIYIKAKLK